MRNRRNINIGSAHRDRAGCEFDYAGTQACKASVKKCDAVRASNPATSDREDVVSVYKNR